MADFNNSTNMDLPIPAVGIAPGPEWATLLNACLTIIDGHTHSTGSGVEITPNALNINSDLTFNSNNATQLRSARFSANASPLALASDVGCIYVSQLDLWYNDINGNQVQITANGAVAGTPGSISNLVSPASASYVAGNQTFVWQSSANTAANMDAGSIIIRNITANSFGVTLAPVSPITSNYTLTLPTIPLSKKIVTIDTSGNIVADTSTDGVTTEIVSNNIQVKDGGVSRVKQTPLGEQYGEQNPASQTVVTTSSYTVITGTTVTLTVDTSGRPVHVGLTSPSGNNNFGYFRFVQTHVTCSLQLLEGANIIASTIFNGVTADSGTVFLNFPASMIQHVYTPAAGTYTYTVQLMVSGPVSPSVDAINLKMFAFQY